MKFEVIARGKHARRGKHAASRRAVEESEMSAPTASISDTSDAAELVAAIDEVLGGA